MSRLFIRAAISMVAGALLLTPMFGLAQSKAKSSAQRAGGGELRVQAPGGAQRMGFRMGGSGAFLLRDPKVQKELGLSASQKSKIDAIMKKMPGRGGPGAAGGPGANQKRGQGTPDVRPRGEMLGQMQKNEQAIMAVLSTSQKARLKQLQCQRSGPVILMSDEYAKQIGLTASQKQQITKNLQTYWEKNAQKPNANQKGQRMDGAQMEKMRTESNNQILKVLTAAQKQKWAAMKGKPFTFSERGR